MKCIPGGRAKCGTIYCIYWDIAEKGGRRMREKKSGVMHFPQSVRIAIFILIFIVLLTVYVCLFQMIQQSAEAGRQRARELETIFTLTL